MRTLWAQLTAQSEWKEIIAVFSDQMFGSGKSFFGKFLISKAKTLKSEISDTLLHLKHDENDLYFGNFNSWFPPILDRIFESTQISWRYYSHTIAELEKVLNFQDDVFIHIDELSGDEAQVRELWQYLNAKQVLYINKPYNKILTYYLSGRNTLINKVNSKLTKIGTNLTKGSPTQVYWLLLPALKVQHVTEIYQKNWKNLHIKIDEPLEEFFLQKLTEFSGFFEY